MTTRSINLGSDRRSGRTTTMLAILHGLQLQAQPALYVCSTASLSSLARARTRHEVRCMSVEQFVRCGGLAGTVVIGMDDTSLWPPAMLDEATSILRKMAPTLRMIVSAS